MGHNFGMSHDFDPKHGGKTGPCNSKGIMSYGDKLERWSSCSVSDFTGYYNSRNWGNTCMKGKYLIMILNCPHSILVSMNKVFQ